MYVTRTGKLKKRFLPAVYFDSSVLIDYWRIEGLELDIPMDPIERAINEYEPEHLKVVRELLKADNRMQKMVEVRKRLLFETTKLSAVVSPISLLELMEWNAEAFFKQTAAEAGGVLSIQRKSKKEIGGYLKKLLELRNGEIEEQKEKTSNGSTGLQTLMSETWLNKSFAECHGLQGLLQANIVNFKLTIDGAWQEPSAYAYLQLGISDILHILFAKHLGCSYIASFDSDFHRVSDIIETEAQIRVLKNPEEILEIL